MPVSAVLITFGAVSPRASFDSDMDLQREPSSDAESPEYQYDQGQEPGDSSPTPQYRADYRSQRSGSNSTSQGQRDTDHQDQPQLEPTAAGEEVPFRQFLTRLCPVYREVDSPPPSCCLRSRPSSPSVPLNEDEACSTATTAFSPSSHPFPLASTTKAICEDAKLPLVVRTWGPVVAGMIALSYTWEHIDRMVDELMNQTIRTVY